VSYVLLDHGLTPFSPLGEIEGWIDRVRRMLEASPNNDELREALQELERLRGMAKGQEPGR
jgi:hypothetical protein